jgi:hypothetical protein
MYDRIRKKVVVMSKMVTSMAVSCRLIGKSFKKTLTLNDRYSKLKNRPRPM